MPDRPVLEYHDPATLLTDRNIRDTVLDPDFVASIKANGLLQPPLAYRTDDGIRVWIGNRRTLGSVKAAQKEIPVLVLPSEPTGAKADIARVIGQYDENERRLGLSGKDQAHVVELLLDFGMTPAQITKQTKLSKDQVAAAQTVKASEAARAAAANAQLSLEHLAGIAEFDGHDVAVKKLTEAAYEGDGTFRHTLQLLRNERTEREAHEAKAAELTAAGVKILTERITYENQIDYWADASGTQLTPETHKECPGSAAVIQTFWRRGDDAPDHRVTYYCDDPKTAGHRKYRATGGSGSSGGQTSEEEKRQRRITIAGNREWRAAETVRREWLREFMARKSAPAGAVRYLCEAIASGDISLQRSMQYPAHKLGTELLGIDGEAYDRERTGALEDLFAKANDARGQVIALGLVLAAQEGSTGVHTWRTPTSHTDTARYLSALAGWDYFPSAIERAVMDGKPYSPDLGDTAADPEPEPGPDSDD